MRKVLLRRSAAACGLVVALAVPVGAAAQTACDRSCLTRAADAWFAALAAHDATKAPIAPHAKFTEQGQVKPIGEGLFKTASEAPTTFKVYVADPVVSQVGGIVMMQDAGKPIQVAFRLKVENGRITEGEHLIWANVTPATQANLVTPRPGLLETVAPAERLPREVLLLYLHGYYDAIEQSDGHAVPFADECVRREGGIHTAGPRAALPAGRAGGPVSAQGSAFGSMTCAAQLSTRFMSYIEEIALRRVWIADEEKGLVFGLSMFRHPMNVKVLQLVMPDGTRSQRDMTTQRVFDMGAAHILKVRNRKIHEIEATGYTTTFNSMNGWSEFLR